MERPFFFEFRAGTPADITVAPGEQLALLTATLHYHPSSSALSSGSLLGSTSLPRLPCAESNEGTEAQEGPSSSSVSSSSPSSNIDHHFLLTYQHILPPYVTSYDQYASDTPSLILGRFPMPTTTMSSTGFSASSLRNDDEMAAAVANRTTDTPSSLRPPSSPSKRAMSSKKRLRDDDEENDRNPSAQQQQPLAQRLGGLDRLKIMCRGGVTLRLTLSPSCPLSVSQLTSCFTVTLTGTLLQGLPLPSPWRPVLVQQWFTVKPNVRRSSHPAAGTVVRATKVSCCGHFVGLEDGSEMRMAELQPYRKVLTPASADRVVRIRRFPHRNADIIGTVPFGTLRVAIGSARDEVHGNEEYVRWADSEPIGSGSNEEGDPTEEQQQRAAVLALGGGWSRVEGSEGPFLIESRLADCKVLCPPRLFTSSREEKGVRVRTAPTLVAKQISVMEPNEVREGIALHTDEVGNTFVEWKDGGGFSCVGGLRGNFLIDMTPTLVVKNESQGDSDTAGGGPQKAPHRQPALRSKRAPSPEVVEFHRGRGGAPQNNSHSSATLGRRSSSFPPTTSQQIQRSYNNNNNARNNASRRSMSEDDEDDSEVGSSRTDGAEEASGDEEENLHVEDPAVSPSLVPEALKAQCRAGRVPLNQLPQVQLNGEEEEEEEDDEDDFDDESDDGMDEVTDDGMDDVDSSDWE